MQHDAKTSMPSSLQLGGLPYCIKLLRLLSSVSDVIVFDGPIWCSSSLPRGIVRNVWGQNPL